MKEFHLRSYIVPIIVAVVALFIIFIGAISGFYTDWLWFEDLGYGKIFSTWFLTKIEIGAIFGILFFAIIYGNLWYARKIAPPPSPLGIEQQLMQRLGRLARRGIGLLIFGGSIVISAMVALEAAVHWQEWLMYFHSTPFGKTDPLFHKDIGFYVFQLPLISYLYHWLFFAIAAAVIASAAFHYADEAIEFFAGRLQIAPKAKVHLSVLLAMLFFLKAAGYRLSMYGLLITQGSIFDGPGYTDVHARLIAYWILLVAAIIGGLLVLFNIGRRGISYAAGALIGLVGVSIIVGSIYPGMVQAYSVQPNELAKESPYITRAIANTRDAYGLSDVVSRPFAADPGITPDQINANSTTIDNIRLWDAGHLRSAYNQIQNIKQYYSFQDVDVDRYWITENGQKRYQQVWLSARELSQSEPQTWVNQHLQYTHGYGFVMSPVNQVDPEGMPNFFVKDLPPKTNVDIPIKQMGVYFGELTNDYAFVNTKTNEFDYSTGAKNKYTTYAGDGGVEVGGFLRKLMFSFRFSDVNMLLNESITNKSKVLFQRDINQRVQKLLPFLRFDSDPYLITAGGRLYWMQDAYTTTDNYPYSQHISGGEGQFDSINYIRNSVKVVTDAYTGHINAYVIQKPAIDPIIKTYQKIFPGVFKPISQMPAALRDHVRYPEDLFRIQTVIYRNYHIIDPTAFYNKSDLWDVPLRAELVSNGDDEQSMEPYYTIMKLPNGSREEFIIMTPYIRAGKSNMVSWMCAKCDANDYGRLVLFQFPVDKNVYGPQQIAARAKQDTDISGQLTLWSQQGSKVGSGNFMVIPIESSLLYVMPVYLESTNTGIPELKRVIVALGNKIVMEPTLADALAAVVGARISTPATTAAPGSSGATAPSIPGRESGKADPEVRRLIDQAVSQYNNAQKAQQRGDWTTYGEQIKALQQTLKDVQTRTK